MKKMLFSVALLAALLFTAAAPLTTAFAELGPMPTCNPNGNGHCK